MSNPTLSPYLAGLFAIAGTILASISLVLVPLSLSHPLMIFLFGMLLLVILMRPQVGAIMMLATLWLAPLFPATEALTLNRLIGLATLTGVLMPKILKTDSLRFSFSRFDYLTWGFILVAILSIVINGLYSGSVNQLWDLLMGYLLYWLLVTTLNSLARLRQALWSIVGFTVIVALSTVFGAVQSQTTFTDRRIEGIQDVNITGPLMVTGIIMVLWLADTKNRREKLLSTGLIGLFSMALILSGNRSGFLALLVSLPLLALLSGEIRWRIWRQVLTAILIISVVVTTSYIAPVALGRSLSFTIAFDPILASDQVSVDEGEFKRVFLYQAALQMFSDRPVLGIGFGGFPDLFWQYAPVFGNSRSAIHSTFMGTLAETGAVGFVILLLMYLEYFKSLLKVRRRAGYVHLANYAIVSLVAITLAQAMFHVATISRLMFIIFGIGAVVVRLSDLAADDLSAQEVKRIPGSRVSIPTNGVGRP